VPKNSKPSAFIDVSHNLSSQKSIRLIAVDSKPIKTIDVQFSDLSILTMFYVVWLNSKTVHLKKIKPFLSSKKDKIIQGFMLNADY
jgi:hypothetical protein